MKLWHTYLIIIIAWSAVHAMKGQATEPNRMAAFLDRVSATLKVLERPPVIITEPKIPAADLTIETFSMQKMGTALQNLGLTTVAADFDYIKDKLSDFLNNFTNAIIGMPLLEVNKLNNAFIDWLTAQRGGQKSNLEQLRDFVSIARACLADPQKAIQIIEQINSATPSLAFSIKNSLASVIALIQSTLASNNSDNQAAVAAFRTILNSSLTFIDKLYAHKDKLKDLYLADDRRNITYTLFSNIQPINHFIDSHMPQLIDIVQKTKSINDNDLRALDPIVTLDLKKAGLIKKKE